MSDSALSLIAFVEGRLIAIEGVRETRVDGKLVRLSKAIFLINFGVHLKMGITILWEEQAYIVLDLRLGEIYRFIVGLEMEEDLYLLYFLPPLTRFEESNDKVSESRR